MRGRSASRRLAADDHVVLVGKPLAGLGESLAKLVHHEVDGATVCTAGITAVVVLRTIEGQRRTLVFVERTVALVSRHIESQSLSDPLYWEVDELLKLDLVNHNV